MRFDPLVQRAFENANIDISTLGEDSGRPCDPESGVQYFVKTAGADQIIAEHESLRAMTYSATAGFVPRSFAIAVQGKQAGMVSEYFSLGGKKDQAALGKALAEMHSTHPDITQFGFAVDTFCGVTRQDNTWTEGWKDFFVNRRLGDLISRLKDPQISKEWEKMQEKTISLLLDNIDPAPQPIIVHGDLWSGNVATNSKTGQPVIFDPSSCYAHNEYELGICNMFGGFTDEFFDAYHAIHPCSKRFYKERLQLYELYHHVNHALMFGGGYKSGAVSIMRSLIGFAEKHSG